MVLKFITPENVDYYDLTKGIFEIHISTLMGMIIEDTDESLYIANEAKWMNPEEFKNIEPDMSKFKSFHLLESSICKN